MVAGGDGGVGVNGGEKVRILLVHKIGIGEVGGNEVREWGDGKGEGREKHTRT